MIAAEGTWYPVLLRTILGVLWTCQYQMREMEREHTLGQELLHHLCGILVHLLERAAYLPHDAPDLRRMPSRTTLEQPRIAARDLFDDLGKTSVLPQVVTVQLSHVRTICNVWDSEQQSRRENALLDEMQEPPVRDVSYASEDVHEFAPTNKRHPEERSAGHDLGVIQIP